ncbi:MAG TPA: hypothetical protein VF190_05185 [Rhodothermales bacterium]
MRHYSGHAHFWDRALSRRTLLRAAAAGTAGVLTSGLWMPVLAQGEDGAEPRPIPGGVEVGGQTFHLFLPELGNEPSTITDFKGFVGLAVISGQGLAIGGGAIRELVYQVDLRFMKGTYVGVDGQQHQGTFHFI